MCFTEMLMADPKDHPVNQLLNPGIKWPVCPHQHLSPFVEVVTGRGGAGLGEVVRAGVWGYEGTSQANEHIILLPSPAPPPSWGRTRGALPCPEDTRTQDSLDEVTTRPREICDNGTARRLVWETVRSPLRLYLAYRHRRHRRRRPARCAAARLQERHARPEG